MQLYIYNIFNILFHYGLSWDIGFNAVEYSALQFIHSLYNSLHLLILTSYSVPLPTPSPLAVASLFPMFMILFLLLKEGKFLCIIF